MFQCSFLQNIVLQIPHTVNYIISTHPDPVIRYIDVIWCSTAISAVIDCRKYRLSEYSWNDTTCRLLMAMSIHKRHGKNHRKFTSARCYPYAEWHNVPATQCEVCFWSKHCTWLAKMDRSMIFWVPIVPILTVFFSTDDDIL